MLLFKFTKSNRLLRICSTLAAWKDSILMSHIIRFYRNITTDKNMNYKEQKAEWLRKHPKATAEEAYEAGYKQSTDNWCRRER